MNTTNMLLDVGKKASLAASVLPNEMKKHRLQWASSDESVATVDKKGTVTGKSIGSCTISCRTDDGSGIKTTCTVVVQRLVSSLAILQKKAEMNIGKTLQLTATVKPDDAENSRIVWSSSDDSVASIDETGLISAIDYGETVITCVSADGSNITAECHIAVEPKRFNLSSGEYTVDRPSCWII